MGWRVISCSVYTTASKLNFTIGVTSSIWPHKRIMLSGFMAWFWSFFWQPLRSPFLSSHVVNKLKPFPGLVPAQVTIILGCATAPNLVAGYSAWKSGLIPAVLGQVFHGQYHFNIASYSPSSLDLKGKADKGGDLRTLLVLFRGEGTSRKKSSLITYLHTWIKRDQLDVTCFIISLFNAPQELATYLLSYFMGCIALVRCVLVLRCGLAVVVWYPYAGW